MQGGSQGNRQTGDKDGKEMGKNQDRHTEQEPQLCGGTWHLHAYPHPP